MCPFLFFNVGLNGPLLGLIFSLSWYIDRLQWGVLIIKMHRLPNRGASSSLVANKHFIEIMAHQSSIYTKKLNWRFEPLDCATSDSHPKR